MYVVEPCSAPGISYYLSQILKLLSYVDHEPGRESIALTMSCYPVLRCISCFGGLLYWGNRTRYVMYPHTQRQRVVIARARLQRFRRFAIENRSSCCRSLRPSVCQLYTRSDCGKRVFTRVSTSLFVWSFSSDISPGRSLHSMLCVLVCRHGCRSHFFRIRLLVLDQSFLNMGVGSHAVLFMLNMELATYAVLTELPEP